MRRKKIPGSAYGSEDGVVYPEELTSTLHAVSFGHNKRANRLSNRTSCVFRLLVPSIVSHYFIFSRAIPSVELQDIRKHDRSAVNLLIEPSFA